VEAVQISPTEGLTFARWNGNAVMARAVFQMISAAMGNALIHMTIPTTVAVAAM